MFMIRRLKLAYALYNLFQRSALAHNLQPYRAAGLRKPYWAPVSSTDFPDRERRDVANLNELVNLPEFQVLTDAGRASLLAFNDTGYAILDGFMPPASVATLNAEIEKLLAAGTLDYRYGSKLMFAIHHSPELRRVITTLPLLPLLDVLLAGKARLFQSINFLRGSQQRTHSDSIHMTTYPLGGLLGVWIALEDVTQENGPLHYYPGSHRLDYVLGPDFAHGGNALLIGPEANKQYEQKIDEEVNRLGLKKQVFQAKAGDVLIWHANLLHGGEPHLDAERTRKSMVLHYFDERRACYHEITNRPALFQELL